MLPVALLGLLTSPVSNIQLLADSAQLTQLTSSDVIVAQSIQPAVDDVGTIVTITNNQFDITGGQTASDGSNLVHSFNQFSLSAEQTANFVTHPQVQNVLGRVSGNNASYIDGILQISNSDANLYLINPAGILFGQNAQLDLTGSFTATTADQVGFDSGWLDAFDSSDYSQLVGNPTKFSFGAAQPGSVVNLGDLAVSENQSLTLLGGNVLNLGDVSAPAGWVTLGSVSGQQVVTLGLADGLLTMELNPLTTDRAISALTLPDLLTGGDLSGESELVVTSDGQVSLQEVIIPEGSGTLATAGNLDVASQQVDEQGGELNLIGERIALLDATVNASGVAGGGTIRIGGGYQGNDPIPNAAITYVSPASTITTNGGHAGEGGSVIVWADGLTRFYGEVEALGGSQSGNGGFVEISGHNSLVFDGQVDLSAPTGKVGTLLLDPRNITIIDSAAGTASNDTDFINTGGILLDDVGPDNFQISRGTLESFTSFVLLSATDSIILSNLSGDSLNLQSDGIQFYVGDGGRFSMDASDTIQTNGGSISIWASDIDLGNIVTGGGNVFLSSNGTTGPEVILQGDTLISSESTVNGDGYIIIDGNINGNQDLMLDAGTENVTVGGTLGNYNAPLKSVGIIATDINFSELYASGGIILDGAITLTGNTVVESRETDIIFTNDINGSYDLRVTGNYEFAAEDSVTFLGEVGNITPLASLSVNGITTSVLGGNVTTTGGDIDLGGSIQLTDDTNLSTGNAVNGDIVFFAIDGDGSTLHNLTIQTGQGTIRGRNIGLSEALNTVMLDGSRIQISNIDAEGDITLNAQTDIDVYSGIIASRNDISFNAQTGIDIDNVEFASDGDIALNSQADIEIRDGKLVSEGTITLNSQVSIDVIGGEFRSGEDLFLLAPETVTLQDRRSFPIALDVNDDILIMGDQSIMIQATSNGESKIQSGGDTTLISDSPVLGNAQFVTGGAFAVETTTGEAGGFIALPNSLISSVGDVTFGDYEGLSLKVESQGSITGGDITITHANALLPGTEPDLATLAAGPSLILRAGVASLQNAPNVSANSGFSVGETSFSGVDQQSTPGTIKTGDISTGFGHDGSIILSAPGTIETGNIRGSAINLSSNENIITGAVSGGEIPDFIAGDNFIFDFSADNNIQVETIDVYGNVRIDAGGTFRAVGSVLDRDGIRYPQQATVSGAEVLGITLPVSITARNSGRVDIQHGGQTFLVGPSFQTDETGEIIIRRIIQRDVNGAILEQERVFPVRDQNGNIDTSSFTPNKDGQAGLGPIYRAYEFNDVEIVVFTEPPNTSPGSGVSFTTGAIITEYIDASLTTTLRDNPLVGAGTTSIGDEFGAIEITSVYEQPVTPVSPTPPVVDLPVIEPDPPVIEPPMTEAPETLITPGDFSSVLTGTLQEDVSAQGTAISDLCQQSRVFAESEPSLGETDMLDDIELLEETEDLCAVYENDERELLNDRQTD